MSDQVVTMGEAVSPLAARRLAVGNTQEGLAEQLGVDRGTVGRWERGAQVPQPWQRADLAKHLKVSLTDLDVILDPTTARDELGAATPNLNPAAGDADSTDGRVNAEHVRRNQQEWLRVRQAPGVRGRELTELAAWLYPKPQRAPGGHVLAGSGWLLDEPIDLDSVRLQWSEAHALTPKMEPLGHVLPLTDRGKPYSGYSRAVRDLVRPRLLENRLSYRLLDLRTGDGWR